MSFLLADAQALELPPEFDVAFSNSTLHWIPDHPAVLRGVAGALKPGGRIFLSMSGRGTAAVVLSVIDGLAQTEPWCQWLRAVLVPWYFFGPEEYGAWLPAAGLIPRRVQLVPRKMRQAGRAGLESWLRTAWMPYTDRVPPDDRALFVSEVAGRVEAQCGTAEDGAILLPMVNLEVEAEKPTT
jgi:trans-aconitate methyltransferase